MGEFFRLEEGIVPPRVFHIYPVYPGATIVMQSAAYRSITKITLALIFLSVLVTPGLVFGGFGITPPYVQKDNLARGSHYEQRIILVRSDPEEELQANVTVNVPKANDWISVDRGFTFLLPKGERQVPMVVSVDVPADAPFGGYSGSIQVVITSPGGPQPGTVGISLGAIVDVALNIIDLKIFEFEIKNVMPGGRFYAEEGHKRWLFFFPGKVRFDMTVENIGNVPSAPTKVELEIYDAFGKEVLESLVNTNKIPFVDPFKTEMVTAEFPTRLAPGSYLAKYRIYNRDVVVQENELKLDILPYGTDPNYPGGYGFSGLTTKEKTIIVGGGSVLLILLVIVVWMAIRVIMRMRRRNKSWRGA